ncbi:DUF1501 domain-containing protein [Paracoccaceae bacterium GXU_MW_L88]
MLTRRSFLGQAALSACSLAAMPLITPITLAATPGEKRFVTIILRGAMDGLDVVRPYGDPLLAQYRPKILGAEAGATDLDGFYALHPALKDLRPLWDAKDLSFAHAVSTPYRDKRSHFDGQDLLEAGTGMDAPREMARSGWLNRLIQTMPDATAATGYSVGTDQMPIMAGDAKLLSWSPQTRLVMSPQAELLLNAVYEEDPLFHSAAEQAFAISKGEAANSESEAKGVAARIAEFAGQRLNEDTRIAAFSLNGWDTHRAQSGGIKRALAGLSSAILTLKQTLGPNWENTAVMAMTEFGRTARENGSGGTDHGTGGALVMAGGAIRGGQVFGDWPGLADSDLFAGRDLMPTADVRAYAGSALHALYGVTVEDLETKIFPGLDASTLPNVIG